MESEPAHLPQLHRRSPGLRTDAEPPVRTDRQLLQGTRRPARPGFHQQGRPLAYTESPVKRFVGAWRWMVSRGSRTKCGWREPGAGQVRGHRERDSEAEVCRADWNAPAHAPGHRDQLPATGPVYEHVPVQRQRNVDTGHARLADGHELPADPRQPLQLRGDHPDIGLGLQLDVAGERPAYEQHVPGRHQFGEHGQRARRCWRS